MSIMSSERFGTRHRKFEGAAREARALSVSRSALLRQVGLVVILTALAKVAAFAKDVLLSLKFGAGPMTDAYFIANTIPGFVFGGVFATIGMVFLPAFKRALFEDDFAASTTYRTAVVVYTALSAVLGALTFLGAGIIVSMLAPSLPNQTRDLAVLMTRIMAFSFVFSGWVGLQNAVLQSHKLLIWPQVVQLLSHMFVIGGLVLATMTNGSIMLLVYAAVIGWMVVAPLISLRAAEFWPKASGMWFDRRTAWSMAALSFPVFLSLSLDQASILIGTYLGSSFPVGAVSHLNYASRLVVLLSSVFSLVIAYVLFPYLTESIIAKRVVQARRYIALALIAVLLFSAPMMVVGLSMSEALISFVFQRGAFRPEDAAASGLVLAYLAPVIILAGIREVLNRLFLAWQQTGVLLLFGVLAMVVNMVASVYFSDRMGLEGIALGSTCGALVYVVAQVSMILLRHGALFHRDLPLWLGLITVASLTAALAGGWVQGRVIFANARLDFLLDVITVFATFGVIIAMAILASARIRGIYKTEPEA